MNQPYTLLTTLLATWTFDESEAVFTVNNRHTLNGYVGWFGLYVDPAKLVCAMSGSVATPDIDKILTGHVGAIRFSPQPLTLA